MRAILLTLALLAIPARATDLARWRAEAARVTIVRDDWGIAHVHGKTDADAVFGMIYAQAEDDFNRVETNYLNSLGRLAEAEGEGAIWSDLRQRLFVDPEDLKARYAASPPWLKVLMDAWADGLNFYLATHPAIKPRVLNHFEPWMALSFSEGSIGGDIERVSLDGLKSFYGGTPVVAQRHANVPFFEPKGSNGIAIAPKLSASGHALLWINPHTSFFFRAEQQMTSDTGLNVYGAATWGQFFIYQGFNAQAGWMHTSSGVDNVDEFANTIVETRVGPPAYKYGTGIRRFTAKTIAIAYRDGGTWKTRSFRVFYDHRGPVVRIENSRWISVQLMNRPVEALEQSFLRTKAHDYASFLKVAELKANSSNNTIFADSKGEIAYLHPQFVPVRDDRFDYTRPVDGSDPAADWKGLHTLASLPRVADPANGWIFNVNDWPWSAAGANSPKAAAFPRYMDQVGENQRGVHAARLLSAAKALTPRSLAATAFDPWMPGFTQLLPPLLRAYDASPRRDLAEPIALLRAWDQRWAARSEATSLAVFWAEALWTAAGIEPHKYSLEAYDEVIRTTSNAAKLDALEAAVGRLTRDFGGWRVAWGEINRFQRNDGAITQTFDDGKPSIPVPFASAQWGSLASFGAKAYRGTRRYYGTSGNSFLAAVEFGQRVKAIAITAGGESGDPKSPHFDDQATRYASGNLRPVYFYPDELKGHIERTYRPGD